MDGMLLHVITTLLDERKWSKKKLSEQSGIHYSDISRIFNNKKPLSLQSLDLITEAFGLPRGTFYAKYIPFCFNEKGHLDKRRSVAFLYRCAVNGYKKEMNDLLDVILEEASKNIRTKNIQNVFLVAEQLFLAGHENEALALYETVINHMPERLSEEVAISHYRIFYMIRLTENGQIAMIRALEYLGYMPDEFQELTLLWITATSYLIKQWDDVLHYAKRLEKITQNEDHQGRALMYQCFALTRKGGSIEEILELIRRYEKINDYYAELAVGNRLVALIDLGELAYVDEYLEWLRDREDVYAGIPRILETLVKQGRLNEAENVIKEFTEEIAEMASSSNFFKQQLYVDYCYAHAFFQCEKGHYSEGLLEFIKVAKKVKNSRIHEKFTQCLLKIWQYRMFLTPELEAKYLQLLSINE
ncbi:helix-turn-helix domain-containing protein [[Brevibacterium] frigoritolerans]|nr:helix-turn-helix domain-containing protein [Peribacillus frigoritolerans]